MTVSARKNVPGNYKHILFYGFTYEFLAVILRSPREDVERSAGFSQLKGLREALVNQVPLSAIRLDLGRHICFQSRDACPLDHIGGADESVLLHHSHFFN